MTFLKGHPQYRKPLSKEEKENLSTKRVGSGNPNWRGGKTKHGKCQNADCGLQIVSYKVQKYCSKPCSVRSPQRRRLQRQNGLGRYGEKSSNWRGGRSTVVRRIRGIDKYIEWRTTVFIRDNYTCQMCKQVGYRLSVDHIKPFWKIVEENKISCIEDALNCEELWDIKNGRVLCWTCHLKTDTYGGRKK